MKAWICKALTGEDSLMVEDSASPQCGSAQIKVRNHFAAINFPDVLITRGLYQFKPEPPFIPGSECAGEIIEVGSDITNFHAGQRVLVMCGVGAFAQEVVVSPPAQQVHAIPNSMTFAEGAAFNMVYGTAMHGLKQRGQLQNGETLLVLGAAGGCGSAAIEIGKAMGARVIAGASTDEKCAVASQLGADHTINYGTENLRDRVKAITGGTGADVIFDPVGGRLFDQAKRCTAWNGRYLVIGFAGGEIPTLEANYTILKSMSLVGVAYGMSALTNPAMNAENFRQLFSWHEQGLLKPYIGQSYPFSQLPDACREMHSGKTVGKTVVKFI